MAIDHSRLRAIIKLIRDYKISGSVLTIGVQDIMDTHENIEKLIAENGLTPRRIPADKRKFRMSKGQRIFKELFKLENPMHGDDLFYMLGFDKVDTLELFDDDDPTIIHDLNNPLPAELVGKYDFVLDIGCSEHIYDLHQSMKNLMDAAKPNGVVCYYLPMLGWHNECFYNFQPPLFFDAFSANGFGEMKLWLNYFPKYYLRDKGKTKWLEYQYGDRTKFRKALHYTHLLFAARKQKQMDFVKPLQAYYLQWFGKEQLESGAVRKTDETESHYMLENLPQPIVKMLPVLIPIYRMTPYFISAPLVDMMMALKNWRKLRSRERLRL